VIGATLQKYLPLPVCESCRGGTIRPVDVMNGRVVFYCSNRARCFFTAFADLPSLTKKIIYLDTSVVSRMAKAKARGETDSIDFKLFEALRRGTSRNLIALPGSSIVETEAEFSALSDTIIEMSRQLSDPGLNHELEVKELQLFRAFDQWCGGEPPRYEVARSWRDAFQSDPHVWHSTFNFVVNARVPEDFVASERIAKVATLQRSEEGYRAYERDGYTFDQIVDVEKNAFPQAVIIIGRQMLAAKAAYLRGEHADFQAMWSTTLDALASAVERQRSCTREEAYLAAASFCVSSHASTTPYSYISSRLRAQLAVLCRGDQRRLPAGGDHYDIEHMATFVPYVDVFIADKFFAGIANQSNLCIGEPFGTEIRSLVPKDVPSFIDWLESLAEGSEVADLSERLSESIARGGFYEDFFASFRETDPEAFPEDGQELHR
jgi:hypothetical protein